MMAADVWVACGMKSGEAAAVQQADATPPNSQ